MAERKGPPGSAIDAAWLRDHPLPAHGERTDKNSRGRVLVVGGSRRVPGGLRLTGEAVLRAGAGKVQLATVSGCAMPLGVAMPEAGIIALSEADDGEIGAADIAALRSDLQACDCLLVGPAMTRRERAAALLDALLGEKTRPNAIVLDAAAIHAARGREEMLRSLGGRLVITANPDELASLCGCDDAVLDSNPEGMLRKAVDATRGVVMLKSSETIVAAPDKGVLSYPGGGAGLATGGTGDVLAGIVAGLIARGLGPFEAAAWGVWLHGEAGRRLAEQVGPVGFLARELPPLVPGLMRGL